MMYQKLQEELRGKPYIMLKYDEERDNNNYDVLFNDMQNRKNFLRRQTNEIGTTYAKLLSEASFYKDSEFKLVEVFNKFVNCYLNDYKQVIIMTTYINDKKICKIIFIVMDLTSKKTDELVFDTLNEVLEFIS